MEVTESSLIKALIVDDEALARNRIREILKKDSEIQLDRRMRQRPGGAGGNPGARTASPFPGRSNA